MEQDCGGTDGESPADRGPSPPPPQGGASPASSRGFIASLCGILSF